MTADWFDFDGKTLRHIALTAQRPRKFLRPHVSYDPERERVEIRLQPVAPEMLPPAAP